MRILGLRHGLVALILLVTMPLRVFAMAALPCCPLAEHAGSQHAMHDSANDASSAMPHAHDDDHPAHATTPTCCAVALTSTKVLPALLDYVPPHLGSPRATAIAALPAERPERPPRTIA